MISGPKSPLRNNSGRMLTTIPLLSFILFAVTYPMCFWLSPRDPLKGNFHHFHIGLPAVVAGLSLAGMKLMVFPGEIITAAVVWVVLFLLITFIYWHKETVHLYAVAMVVLAGAYVYAQSYVYLLGGTTPVGIVINFLGGLILAVSFYAMNLGHWYLNVHGLSLDHLKRACLALTSLLGIRLAFDVIMVFASKVLWHGESVAVLYFLGRMDGFFLWIAFFFGTLFPFIAMYFVWGTLKVKSTQSATGILYVLLSAILIGDITYKYYLLQYGLSF